MVSPQPIAVGKTLEEISAERQRLRSHYAELYEAALAILYLHDPLGINFEINFNEYEPEVGTILPRLPSCVVLLWVSHQGVKIRKAGEASRNSQLGCTASSGRTFTASSARGEFG